jgi:hypothetical protein
MEIVDVLPKDPIRSIDSPAFGPEYFGDSGFPLTVDADEGAGGSATGGVDAPDSDETGSPVLRGDGTTWNPATGESADGRSLVRVPTRRLYAFAWQDAHDPGSFYGEGGDASA